MTATFAQNSASPCVTLQAFLRPSSSRVITSHLVPVAASHTFPTAPLNKTRFPSLWSWSMEPLPLAGLSLFAIHTTVFCRAWVYQMEKP
ncbi:unnamed protein product [Spirodela intermedia]|uniref:Uncharacterized protein n=1 Tax=Spirodela intermedia TaxID=51605 RepID=A0A7I8KTG3_SPIIN|nr:unnamed protein product [Spirodela intermedia]